jgi:monovalent cation/proton antiporter MnhG/PhaG subunit
MIADAAAGITMAAGALLMFASALGVLRFPGPVARLHAATKAATLGLALLALGAGFALGAAAVSLVALAVVFQTLTAPIAGHLLARAALAAAPPGRRGLARDDLERPVPGSGRHPPAGALPAIVSVALLAAAWVGLWGDLSVANLAAGIAAGLAVVALIRPPAAAARLGLRPAGLLRFAGAFAAALVRGTLTVAREALDPDDSAIRQAVIRVDLPGSSRAALVLTADAVTLTPGSLTVEVDLERSALYVHVLHFVEADAVRRDVERLHAVATGAVPNLETSS